MNGWVLGDSLEKRRLNTWLVSDVAIKTIWIACSYFSAQQFQFVHVKVTCLMQNSVATVTNNNHIGRSVIGMIPVDMVPLQLLPGSAEAARCICCDLCHKVGYLRLR